MSRFSSSSNNSSLSANILCGIGIVVAFAACGFLYLGYNPAATNIPPVAPLVYSSTATSLPEEGSEEEGQDAENSAIPAPVNIPRNEWYMRLVNYENLLEEDFAVDVVNAGRDFYFDARAVEDLQAFVAGANEADMPVRIVSASRSWENQQARYEQRIDELVEEGLDEDAAAVQATRENELPRASEHILSLGVDILPENNRDMDETIFDEPAYQWLVEHAHEYGFIQRYPVGRADVTGIEFEPWHFRYVGVEQAGLIYESGLTLEEYLAGEG